MTLSPATWLQRADVAEALGICPHHVSRRLTDWTGTLVERREVRYHGARPHLGALYEYRLSPEALRRLTAYRDRGGRPHPLTQSAIYA